VTDAAAAPRASVVVSIQLSAPGDLSAIQFDLEYDPQVMSLATTPGDALRAAAKTLHSAERGVGGKRFLLLGMNATVFTPGPLLKLFFSVNADAPEGVYPLRLSSAIGADPAGNTVPVSTLDGALRIERSAPAERLTAEGVLNSASLQAGPVAPGELVTLLGAGIGEGGSVNVLFDGQPAPVLFAASSQINALAPASLAVGATTRLEVRLGDAPQAGLSVPVAAAAPGLFTQNASGAGPALILHEDATLNTPANPAAKGTVVSLYSTGLGGPGASVAVRIGDASARIVSISDVPGLAGLVEIRAAIPADAPSGLAVPVVLHVGQTQSQPGVTLAIR